MSIADLRAAGRFVVRALFSPDRPLLAREFNTVKDCAPLCSLSCVHQVSFADQFRGK